jgi:hypothetical protein
LVFLSPGDLFGFLAIFFISASAVLMLARKLALRRMKDLESLRQLHVLLALAGGLFMVLHIVLFLNSPLGVPVLLGYAATGAAAAVWLTGSAFLARMRDSLFYHGSISLAAISLMLIHAFSAGGNLPEELSEIVLGTTVFVLLIRTFNHLAKIAPREAE